MHSIETSISVEVDIRDTNENPTSVPVQNVIEKKREKTWTSETRKLRELVRET